MSRLGSNGYFFTHQLADNFGGGPVGGLGLGAEPLEGQKVQLDCLGFPPAGPVGSRKKNDLPVVTQEMLDEMFEGSITQSLTGILHLPDMTPEEIRSERLRKYERID